MEGDKIRRQSALPAFAAAQHKSVTPAGFCQGREREGGGMLRHRPSASVYHHLVVNQKTPALLRFHFFVNSKGKEGAASRPSHCTVSAVPGHPRQKEDAGISLTRIDQG